MSSKKVAAAEADTSGEIDWHDPLVWAEQIDIANSHELAWREKLLELSNSTIENMIPLDEDFVPYGKEREPRS